MDPRFLQLNGWQMFCLIRTEQTSLKTFVIDHDQVLGLLDRKFAKDGKFYSYNELEPYLGQIDQNAREAGKIEREKQDSFDQNIIDLYRSVLLYRKLKHTPYPTFSTR